MKAKKSPEPETKTYVLTLNNDDLRRVTVPASWKLTFGPTIPYAGKGMVSVGAGGTALRFYEGNKENLRAVFTDVKAFRDTSIEIMEKRTETQRKVVQRQTAKGAKDMVVEARITEWLNPDDDGEQTSNPFADELAPDMLQLSSKEY